MKRSLTSALAGLAVAGAAVVPLTLAVPAHADVASKGGDFVAVAPRQMLLDTRSAIGAPKAQVGATKSISVTALGAAGIPSTGVRAVELVVTALNPTTSTYLTVFASGTTQPTTSNFNAPANGGSVSSAVLVPVGTDGKIVFYNNAGSIDIAAAVEGYVTSATAAAGTGGFVPVTPTRVISTAVGTGIAKAQIGAGKSVTATIAGAGIPTGTTIVYGSLQVTGTATGGIVTTPYGATAETHGVMAYHNGASTTAIAMVLSSTGKVTIQNTGTAAIDLYFDVQAYVASSSHAGAGYRPLTSTPVAHAATVAAGGNLDLQIGGQAGVPTLGAAAVQLQFDAKATTAGYLRAYPVENAAPGGVSMLAFDASYRSDEGIITLGSSGAIRVHNFGTATMTVYVEIKGWFDSGQSNVVDIDSHATPALIQPTSGGSIDAAYVSAGGVLFHGLAPVDAYDQVVWAPVPSNLEAFTGEPAIARLSNGNLLISVLHANNGEVWTLTEPAGQSSWTAPFVHTGGIMKWAPTSANLPDGSVVTFGVDRTGSLWVMTSANNYWTLLSANAGLAGSPTVVTTSSGVQVVDTTSTGTVTTASYAGGALSTWNDLGGVGVTDKTAAVVNNGPRVRVVARQSDGTIISKLQSLSGTFPPTWTQAGGTASSPSFIGGPAVGIDFGSGTNPGTGKAFLLARNSDGQLYQNDETSVASGVWGEWYSVAGRANTDVAVAPYAGNANNYHWLGLYLDDTDAPRILHAVATA